MKAARILFAFLLVFFASSCSWEDRNLDAGPDPDGDGGIGDQGSDQGDHPGDSGADDGDAGGETGPRRLRAAVVLGEGGFYGTSGRRVGTVNGHAGGSYVIGAHYADISGGVGDPVEAGRVYLYDNGSIPASGSDAALVLQPPDGAVAGFGYSLCGPCDFNKDTFLDLPVGDHLYSPAGYYASGRVVVFWGDQSGGLSLDRHSYHRLPDNLRAQADSMGQTVLCADFDGDGYDDLLSTGQNAGADDTGLGAIYYGSDTGLPEFPDLLIAPAVAAAHQYFGSAAVYEDLDGDGRRDLAVGAWELIQGTQTTDAHTGGVAVFLGGSDWSQGPDLNLFPPTDQVTHMGMYMIHAEAGGKRFLVVGVPDYPAEDNGSVYVYEVGMADFHLRTPVVILRPPGGMIQTGFPAAMGYVPDFYGRDRGALLVGMKYGDASPENTGTGIVAVFPQTADGGSFEEFADILRAPDPQPNDCFGSAVVPLDDVDGDGLRDFLVGMEAHLEGDLTTGFQTGGVVFFY
jgi:hypothetical protein